MTDDDPPPLEVLWSAASIYLRHAYDPPAPAHVLAQLRRMREATPAERLAGCFEREDGPGPTRYALRLGNRFYPHMKLVLERTNRGPWVFRADTHDLHVTLAPDDPERPALDALRARNRDVASAIESAWEAEGIPTFRGYLQRDLAARRG